MPDPESTTLAGIENGSARTRRRYRAITGAILLASLAILLVWHPKVTSSPDVLRPRRSEASRALALVQENLSLEIEPYWVLINGKTAQEVHASIKALEPVLARNLSEGRISSYQLPRDIWPDVVSQQANGHILREIGERKSSFIDSALRQGFTTNALELTSVVLEQWQEFSPRRVEWPHGRIAEWLLPKFVSITPTNLTALGLLYPTPGFDPNQIVPPEMTGQALVSGWRLLGQQVFAQMKREVPVISAAVLLIVALALYLTFRNWLDVALSFAVLGLSGVLLLATMAILGWDWNLINLTSIPLLLGMGIDYSIHIQLTLRRMNCERAKVFQNVGRALLLAGATSIIGFALLGTSSNLGMSSLGKVCALGLTILLLVSVFLLPGWATKEVRKESASA